jgi:hypothetical protein
MTQRGVQPSSKRLGPLPPTELDNPVLTLIPLLTLRQTSIPNPSQTPLPSCRTLVSELFISAHHCRTVAPSNLPPTRCPTHGMMTGIRSLMYALDHHTYTTYTTDRMQDFIQILSPCPTSRQTLPRRTQSPTPRIEQAVMGCRRTTRTFLLSRSKGCCSCYFRLQAPSQASVP